LVIASWTVILAICAFICFSVMAGNEQQKDRAVNKSDLMQANLVAKQSVGMHQLAPSDTPVVRSLDSGPLEQRYCQAIVINELEGSRPAIEYLTEIDALVDDLEFQMTNDQKNIAMLLENLFADYSEGFWDGPSLTKNEKDELVDQLGWCGKLAIVPERTTNQTFRDEVLAESKGTALFLIAVLVGVVLFSIAGSGLAILAGVFTFTGTIRSGMSSERRNGGIYVETFAIWMISFMGASLLSAILILRFDAPRFVGSLAILATLGVLVWPIIRGVRVATMLDDLGLRWRNPFKEIMCGIVAYIALLPFLGAAIVLVATLTALSTQMGSSNELAPPTGPSHPIQEEIASSQSWLPILNVIFTACIVAPLIEEIVFRGLLYRHKRELSHRWGWILSVAFSSLFNGLLFAMIHPQGIVAIPALATLAMAFCLAREWRGSLVAPMTMHAINNAGITCLLILML